MRNLLGIITIVLMTCGPVLSVPSSAYQQQQVTADENNAGKDQQQEQQNTIVAVVTNVDLFNKILTVTDTWERPIQFKAANAVIRMTKDDIETFAVLSDLKPGDHVQITFLGNAASPQSLKIVILPEVQGDIYNNNLWGNEH